MKNIVVAVDGPAGAGKSTISKLVGEKLNLEYIDTGAMYRALTLKVIKEKISIDNIDEINRIIESTKIDFINNNIYLDGENVSEEIRLPIVNENVSYIAKLPKVREYLVKLQKNMGSQKNVIMDGRDIGSNVLKNATTKIFLTASVEERAKRRYEEFKEKGIEHTLETVIKDIEKRDKIDTTREVSPLRKAKDAILIDTTGKCIDKVVDEIIYSIKEGK